MKWILYNHTHTYIRLIETNQYCTIVNSVKLEATNSFFRLVNILLQKFLIKKRSENDKNTFMTKKKKKSKRVVKALSNIFLLTQPSDP